MKIIPGKYWPRLMPFVLVLVLSGAAWGQSAPPVYTIPLGIALETFPYPYPVQFLSLENQGQSLRLAYMDIRPTGSGQAESVVLLHGKNFYGSYWLNTIKALTAAGYRVIVPDQIGFGKSAKPDLCYSFDQLAANTAKLLDHSWSPKSRHRGAQHGGYAGGPLRPHLSGADHPPDIGRPHRPRGLPFFCPAAEHRAAGQY